MVAHGDAMASRTTKIGPQTVAGMKPDDVVWDCELSRFGVRRRAGSVTYFVKARIDGRQRWISVGRHGPTTAAEARAKARHVLGEIDSGQDPTRERDGRRTIPNFSAFAEKWLREHVCTKRKRATQTSYRRIVERHLNPALGKVRVDRINRTDVLDLHADLVSTRYQANRVVAVLSAMMSFAEKLGHRPQFSNPCRGIERFKELKRKRPLTMKELATLWAHLETISSTTNPFIVGAFRLLILTGMRREEVLGLHWADVDRDAGLLRLPDAKTGPRAVILSREALDVLERLPIVNENPYVFAGQREGQRLVNISGTWQEIRKTLGFPEVRIHDLRHTVASVLAKSASLIVVRDAMGHAEIGTTSDYSHAADDDVRQAVQAFSNLVAVSRDAKEIS